MLIFFRENMFIYNPAQPNYLNIGIYNATLAQTAAEFVPVFATEKPTRRAKIWLEYQRYLTDLQQIIGLETSFFQ